MKIISSSRAVEVIYVHRMKLLNLIRYVTRKNIFQGHSFRNFDLPYVYLNSFISRLIVILRAKRMRKKNGLVPSDNNQYTG